MEAPNARDITVRPFAILVALVAFLIPVLGWTQTAADFATKYPPVSAYEVRPGILMTAKYAEDGQICQMVLEPRHYQSGNNVDLHTVIPAEQEKQVLDELVPPPERGEPKNRWSNRAPKDSWVDPDSYVAGGVSYIKRSYENVSIEQHGYYRCQDNPPSKKANSNLDCSEGGDEAVVIRWTKRSCTPDKTNQSQMSVPARNPVTTPPEGIIPDEITAVKVAEVVFPRIFGEDEVTKYLPYHAQLKDGVWEVYGTLKPGSRGGTPQMTIQKKDGKVIDIWHSQ